MRKYRCENCKEASFESQMRLTRHLGKCKKGVRPSVKGKLSRCPECSEKVNYMGLGSHRRNVHGVAGTSRWSLQAKNKKAVAQVTLSEMANPLGPINSKSTRKVTLADIADPMPVVTSLKAGSGRGIFAKPPVFHNQGIEKPLLDEAAVHRQKAVEHLNKAERLTKMAAELKEMSS